MSMLNYLEVFKCLEPCTYRLWWNTYWDYKHRYGWHCFTYDVDCLLDDAIATGGVEYIGKTKLKLIKSIEEINKILQKKYRKANKEQLAWEKQRRIELLDWITNTPEKKLRTYLRRIAKSTEYGRADDRWKELEGVLQL